jgi:tetratricopeptide (TPR) repeat protein
MAAQNLRTLVEMDQKKLSFESSVNESQKQLISVVQTDGVLVFERKKPITKEMVSATQGDTEKLLSHLHQGLISEMEFIFTTAKKILEKPSSHMCFAMGVILLTRGFYNDAIQQFQKSVELDPGHIQAIKHYGIALTLKGDYENALHVFNHILESGPAYADVYYYLGNVYLFQRQFEKAKKHYEQAVKINPNYADAHLRLATCAVAVIAGENSNLVGAAVQGYVDEAQRETQLALDCNSKVMSGALLTGTANLKSGKYQMAFKNYLEARPKYSAKTGSEVVYFYTLKLLYGDKGVSSQETEEYVRQLEQLVETNPSYVDLRLHYGMGTLMKSNFLIHRSLKEMNKAIEVNPNFQQAKTTADTLTDIYKKMLQTVKSVYHSGGG